MAALPEGEGASWPLSRRGREPHGRSPGGGGSLMAALPEGEGTVPLVRVRALGLPEDY
jgi:hypothetical protein